MPAKIISLPQFATHEAPRRLAHESLAAGELVIFPTETVYGIAVRADSPDAIHRLMEAKKRPEKNPFTVVVADAARVRDYLPRMGVLADRLARRCFPGPITLVGDASDERSLVHRLPPETKKYVAPENFVGIRVPAHSFTLDVLHETPFPVVLTSANLSGEADTTSAADVIAKLADRVDIIFEDGDCQYKKPSTVVKIPAGEENIEILREGVLTRDMISALCEPRILFVCTGNTCRSPMAEAIAREMLAGRDVSIHSAGVSAVPGEPASDLAIQTVGPALASHVSRPLTSAMLATADFIYAMTPGHASSIRHMEPEAAARVHVLAEETGGIRDPFNGTLSDYHHCAEQIARELEREFSSAAFLANIR